MKARLRYPARVYRDPDDPDQKSWLVAFPGLGGKEIMTCGISLDHAREMARECLSVYILSKLDRDEQLEDGETCLPAGVRIGGEWEWMYPEPQIDVALTIREIRRQAGLTQEEAAHLIGVTQTTYTRWEDPDKCNATLKTLEKIARAFGKRLDVAFR